MTESTSDISLIFYPLFYLFLMLKLWVEDKNGKIRRLRNFFFAYNFSRFQYAPATYPVIYLWMYFSQAFKIISPIPVYFSTVSYCACMHAHSFNHVLLFVIPWTVACKFPPPIGFSRQEYWGGLQFPTPGHLPNPGTKPLSFKSSVLSTGFFTTSATWEAPSTI